MPQGADVSNKVCDEVRSLSTPNNQQVVQQVSKGEAFQTFNREGKAVLTRIGDVQYDGDLSTKITVQEKTPQRDIKKNSPTFRERATGMKTLGCSGSCDSYCRLVYYTQDPQTSW